MLYRERNAPFGDIHFSPAQNVIWMNGCQRARKKKITLLKIEDERISFCSYFWIQKMEISISTGKFIFVSLALSDDCNCFVFVNVPFAHTVWVVRLRIHDVICQMEFSTLLTNMWHAVWHAMPQSECDTNGTRCRYAMVKGRHEKKIRMRLNRFVVLTKYRIYSSPNNSSPSWPMSSPSTIDNVRENSFRLLES